MKCLNRALFVFWFWGYSLRRRQGGQLKEVREKARRFANSAHTTHTHTHTCWLYAAPFFNPYLCTPCRRREWRNETTQTSLESSQVESLFLVYDGKDIQPVGQTHRLNLPQTQPRIPGRSTIFSMQDAAGLTFPLSSSRSLFNW